MKENEIIGRFNFEKCNELTVKIAASLLLPNIDVSVGWQ